MKHALIIVALAPMTVMLLIAMVRLLTAGEEAWRPAHAAESPTDASPAADRLDDR